MKKLWAYINHSNLKLAIDLNPFVWSFRYMYQGPDRSDPDLNIWYIRILPLSIILTIDTGRFNIVGDDITVRDDEGDTL